MQLSLVLITLNAEATLAKLAMLRADDLISPRALVGRAGGPVHAVGVGRVGDARQAGLPRVRRVALAGEGFEVERGVRQARHRAGRVRRAVSASIPPSTSIASVWPSSRSACARSGPRSSMPGTSPRR